MLNTRSTNQNGASPDGVPVESLEGVNVPPSTSGGSHYPPAHSTPPAGGKGDSIDIGAGLSILWRRRRLMLATFLVVLLGGVLVTARQPSVYESTCSILITSPTDSSPTVSDSLRGLINATQPRSVGTQLAIMRSYPVQRAALKRLPPPQREIAQNYYKLDVRSQRDSDAIDIVAESHDPAVAALLANSLSQEYMWQYQQQNRAQVRAGTREVADQLAGARERLDQAANDLKNYKLNNGTVNLGEESTARLAQINQIENSLRDLKAERAANVARIKSMSGQASAMPKIEVIPERIVRRPALETLQGQLTQLELQRISTLQRYRPGSPEVRDIEKQKVAVQNRLDKMAQTQVSSWIRSVNPVRQGLTQEIASTQSQIWAIDARTKALENSAKLARDQESLLPEREYRLNQLTTEQTVLQQTYQVLNEKYQSLLVSESAKLTTARPLAPAEAPNSPIRPRRSLNILMSLLLGIAMAAALAILVDHMDDRIRSSDDAASAAGLPVLAQVPWIADASKRTLLGQNGATSPLLESFRMLRTGLLVPDFAGSANGASGSANGASGGAAPHLPRSVLVTSSREGEGKSLCALNLAIATALSGRQVVLIDCNLRQPSLHSMLGLKAEPGLVDVAQGKISMENALQESGVRGLRVLTSGSSMANFAELLDSEEARQTLQNAIGRAGFAILDCPSVLNMADTPILATIADSALLVVSSEESEGREVAQTRELLDRSRIHLLGTVLNKVKTSGR